MLKTMTINGQNVVVLDGRTPPNAEEIERKYVNARAHAYSLVKAVVMEKEMGKLKGVDKYWAFFKGEELAMEHIKFVNGKNYFPCFWEYKTLWDVFAKTLFVLVCAA